MIVSHQNLQNIARKRRKSLFGQARELRFFLCQACARPVVEAISFRMGSSEAFVVLACRSTTLLQGSSMAGTTLTLYVGLTPSDAHKILMEHQAVQPHWKDRWGLKTTAMEARTRVFFLPRFDVSWNLNSVLAYETHVFSSDRFTYACTVPVWKTSRRTHTHIGLLP